MIRGLSSPLPDVHSPRVLRHSLPESFFLSFAIQEEGLEVATPGCARAPGFKSLDAHVHAPNKGTFTSAHRWHVHMHMHTSMVRYTRLCAVTVCTHVHVCIDGTRTCRHTTPHTSISLCIGGRALTLHVYEHVRIDGACTLAHTSSFTHAHRFACMRPTCTMHHQCAEIRIGTTLVLRFEVAASFRIYATRSREIVRHGNPHRGKHDD